MHLPTRSKRVRWLTFMCVVTLGFYLLLRAGDLPGGSAQDASTLDLTRIYDSKQFDTWGMHGLWIQGIAGDDSAAFMYDNGVIGTGGGDKNEYSLTITLSAGLVPNTQTLPILVRTAMQATIDDGVTEADVPGFDFNNFAAYTDGEMGFGGLNTFRQTPIADVVGTTIDRDPVSHNTISVLEGNWTSVRVDSTHTISSGYPTNWMNLASSGVDYDEDSHDPYLYQLTNGRYHWQLPPALIELGKSYTITWSESVYNWDNSSGTPDRTLRTLSFSASFPTYVSPDYDVVPPDISDGTFLGARVGLTHVTITTSDGTSTTSTPFVPAAVDIIVYPAAGGSPVSYRVGTISPPGTGGAKDFPIPLKISGVKVHPGDTVQLAFDDSSANPYYVEIDGVAATGGGCACNTNPGGSASNDARTGIQATMTIGGDPTSAYAASGGSLAIAEADASPGNDIYSAARLQASAPAGSTVIKTSGTVRQILTNQMHGCPVMELRGFCKLLP